MQGLRRFLAALFVVGAMIVAAPAWAAVETYHLEKPHTQVLFNVTHMGFSHSWGKFTGYQGEIRLDAEAPKNSFVRATIYTDSLHMNDDKWDAHLKGKDFFDVEKYPEMRFESTAVKITGPSTADVAGNLTLHGVTKPVTLHVTHNKTALESFTKTYRSGFSATGAIKRSDFGMSEGIPLVSDEVKIIIEVEAIRQDNEEQKAHSQ